MGSDGAARHAVERKQGRADPSRKITTNDSAREGDHLPSTRSPLLDVLTRHDETPHADYTPSLYSQFIPVNPITRPPLAQAPWMRPNTGRSHFSIEEARRNQRRIVDKELDRQPRGRGAVHGLGLGQSEAGSREKESARGEHTHNRSACRQCFRAGFDCAVQLQSGKGTAARKALQDFVAAGGMEALSGAEDFFEGSVHASQREASRPASRATGQNFVDKLSEVAFGESALSRPVTRGAFQNMLDDRSKGLFSDRDGKTVNDFLAELQQLQRKQEEQLNEIAADKQRSQTSGLPIEKATRASSSSSAETMHEPFVAEEEAMQGTIRADSRVGLEDDEVLSGSHASQEDFLPFLADRWSMKKKVAQVSFCALWVFAQQCLDSGYVESRGSIAQTTGLQPIILQAGQLAFLAGQGGGFLFGAAVSPFGRYRIQPISAVLSLVVAVACGFMHQALAITALRGVLGCLAGIFEVALCGMVLDLSTTRRERLLLIALVAFAVLLGQAAGPWITRLILSFTTWRWLYWTSSIAALVYILASGILSEETEPVNVFRKLVQRLRVEHRDVWTPEPEPIPRMTRILRLFAVRPFHMLFMHALVTLASIFALVAGAALTTATVTLSAQLEVQDRLSTWQGALIITLCILLGVCAALSFVSLMVASSNDTASEGRKRYLLMDEKGVIDPERPAFGVETLLRNAIIGLALNSVTTYLLALTTTLAHWIIPAMSYALLAAGTTLMVVSIMQYVSEAYFPSRHTSLADLRLLPDQLGGNGMDPALSHQPLSDFDNTLMSGADAEGRRWNSSWALSALAAILSFAFVGAGFMTFVAPLAVVRLGFSVFIAIVASVQLGVGGLSLLLLFSTGARLRHRSFARITQVELRNATTEKRRGASSTCASAQTSTGIARSAPSDPIRFGRNSLPVSSRALYKRWELKDWLKWLSEEDQRGDEDRSKWKIFKDRLTELIPPLKRRSIKASAVRPNVSARPMEISSPFNFQHVATGSMLASPATLRDPVSPVPLRANDPHPRRPSRVSMLEKQTATQDETTTHWTVDRPALRRIGRKELERAMEQAGQASAVDESRTQVRAPAAILTTTGPFSPNTKEQTGVSQPAIAAIGQGRSELYERRKTPPTEIIYKRPAPVTIPTRDMANIQPASIPSNRPVASTSRRTLTPQKGEKGKGTEMIRTTSNGRQARQRQAANGGADMPRIAV